MKSSLAENIRIYRKKRGFTQEQLAEVLNVSVGVISKWELGLSSPDIGIIMSLAELFETSVDVLIGFELQSRTREKVLADIKRLIHSRNETVDFGLIERYIAKFPNDFEIIYRSASLYSLRGTTLRDNSLREQALRLYERSCSLLEQNTNESISYLSIQLNIAWLYRSMNREEDSLALYKKNNPNGLNDSRIGVLLASSLNRPDEAVQYLSNSLIHCVYTLLDVTFGYMNAYDKQERYAEMVEIIQWFEGIHALCRIPGKVGPLDSFASLYLAAKAYALLHMNDTKSARIALKSAYELALRFDECPNYHASDIRFAVEDNATVYDDNGETALIGLEHYINEEDYDELSALWSEIKNEK